MNKYIVVIFVLFLFSSSCKEETRDVGGINSIIKLEEKPREVAEQICVCVTEAGFTSFIGIALSKGFSSGSGKDLKEAETCVKEIIKNNLEYISGLSQEDQRIFLKQVIHALIESSCVDKLIGTIPDMVLEEYL